jgi:hypothetical protein
LRFAVQTGTAFLSANGEATVNQRLVIFIVFTPIFIYKSLLSPGPKILSHPQAVITEPFYRAVPELEFGQLFPLAAFFALSDPTTCCKHGNHSEQHNK